MKRKILVRGAAGKMGKEACIAIDASPDMEVVSRLGRADEISSTAQKSGAEWALDLTRPDALDGITVLLEAGLSVVVGTSGVSEEHRAIWAKLCEKQGSGLLVVPNFCIGVLLMQKFSEEAVRWFPDVEILEMHHEKKVDSPSGTAAATAERIARHRDSGGRGIPVSSTDTGPCRGGSVSGIPIHSLRLPGFLAHQVVTFGGMGELLSIRHDTSDRMAFMPGVLAALRGLKGLRGLHLGLESVLSGF
jgi:4-hydroxy-tetrahydrodipicolinate reductase